MELLTGTDFRYGINAGVPQGITVAHKFGERVYVEKINSIDIETDQLHDCGIVYCPKGPYLICIMTKGHNFDTLKSIIKEISRIAYERQNEAIGVF
jgi:hypothetical protein